MDIRQATTKDCTAIAALWNRVIRASDITFNSAEKTPDMLAVEIAQKTAQDLPFLVGMLGTQMLGFATYGQFRASNGYLRSAESTIYLTDDAQGKGLGRKLMGALEQQAQSNGMHVMIAAMAGTNKKAQDFHAALGYIEVGRMPEVGSKFGRWHDLVLMQKRL